MSKRAILKKIAERKQKEDWKQNPLLWLEERLGEPTSNVVWSEVNELYENHDWDGDENPLAKAWKVLGDSYTTFKETGKASDKYIAIESATGTGKTYWLARLVFWFLDTFDNSLVITSAPSETQLKYGLWSEIAMLYPKIKKLHPKSAKWKTRLAMETTAVDLDGNKLSAEEKERLLADSWHAIAHIAGTSANEESANKARGFHRKHMLIIMEECTGIPNSILTAFQNTSTGNLNFIVAVGNPDNEFDTLHQFAIQKDCTNIRVSALDHPNIVLQKELISGAVTQSSIDSRTENYGKSSPLWKAMVRGISPAQASDALIKLEWVEACINSDHADILGSYNAAGVDVANSIAGDKASVVYGKGNTVVDIKEFYCENATHLAYNLMDDEMALRLSNYNNYNIPTIYQYDITADRVGIDTVGVGVATINAFLDRGLEAVALQGGSWQEVIPTMDRWEAGKKVTVPMWSFPTLRSQMYWELREDLRNKTINIAIDDKTLLNELKKELCIPKVVAHRTSIAVESKEDIKKRLSNKSPNKMDAFAYWNWVRKGYRLNRYGLAAISSGG